MSKRRRAFPEVKKDAINTVHKSMPNFLSRNRFEFIVTVIFSAALLTIISFHCVWGDSQANIKDSPYQTAFSKPKYIMWAVVCTVSITITIGLENILDLLLESGSMLEVDLFQRFLMVLIPVVPGFILLAADETENLPYLFAFCHTTQCLACPGPLFSLCHKLLPMHFTEMKMLTCYGLWAGACVLTILGFLVPTQIWAFHCCLLFCVLSIAVLGWAATSCIASLCRNLKAKEIEVTLPNVHKNLTSAESSCLLYLACHVVTVVLIPFIVGLRHNFNWVRFLESDILAMIYAIALFSALPSCIPGRIARNELKEKEQLLRAMFNGVRIS